MRVDFPEKLFVMTEGLLELALCLAQIAQEGTAADDAIFDTVDASDEEKRFALFWKLARLQLGEALSIIAPMWAGLEQRELKRADTLGWTNVIGAVADVVFHSALPSAKIMLFPNDGEARRYQDVLKGASANGFEAFIARHKDAVAHKLDGAAEEEGDVVAGEELVPVRTPDEKPQEPEEHSFAGGVELPLEVKPKAKEVDAAANRVVAKEPVVAVVAAEQEQVAARVEATKDVVEEQKEPQEAPITATAVVDGGAAVVPDGAPATEAAATTGQVLPTPAAVPTAEMVVGKGRQWEVHALDGELRPLLGCNAFLADSVVEKDTQQVFRAGTIVKEEECYYFLVAVGTLGQRGRGKPSIFYVHCQLSDGDMFLVHSPVSVLHLPLRHEMHIVSGGSLVPESQELVDQAKQEWLECDTNRVVVALSPENIIASSSRPQRQTHQPDRFEPEAHSTGSTHQHRRRSGGDSHSSGTGVADMERLVKQAATRAAAAAVAEMEAKYGNRATSPQRYGSPSDSPSATPVRSHVSSRNSHRRGRQLRDGSRAPSPRRRRRTDSPAPPRRRQRSPSPSDASSSVSPMEVTIKIDLHHHHKKKHHRK